MKQINVMYIFNDMTMGGATQSLIDLLTSIKELVRPVVVMRKDSKLENVFESLGIRYYKINFTTDNILLGKCTNETEERDFFINYSAAIQLVQIARTEKIDIIHINSSVSKVGAMAALMAHIPYVWHIRELLEEHFGCEFINKNLKLDLLEKSDRLITISDFVQNMYLKKYGIDSTRIYNGFNVRRYKNEIVANREYNNIFLVAAMITPEKRQWDAIKAVEILVSRGYKDIKLIIVGQGAAGYVWALKKYIVKNLLEDYICIMPFQRDLSELRKEASYAITCSQCEALGRVTIEAMLAGNIVIGADSGGTVEIIGEKEERGFLYRLGDYQSLASTMIRAIQCDNLKKDRIAKDSQEYVEKVFGLKQYCKSILEVYNEVLNKEKCKKDDIFLEKMEKKFKAINWTEEKKSVVDINQYNKILKINSILAKWLELKQRGVLLEQYFEKHGITKIAIYGIGELGRRLYDELEGSKVEVKYLLDKNPGNMNKILRIYSLDEKEMDVETIVVTVAIAEDVISEIRKKGYRNVAALNEILLELDQ